MDSLSFESFHAASLRTVIKLQKSPHLRNGEKYLTMSHVSPYSSFVL